MLQRPSAVGLILCEQVVIAEKTDCSGGLIMPNPENGLHFENNESGWDSLNSDVVEITHVEVDNTVRPMRASLRQRLKLPSNVAPLSPRQEKKSS